MPAASRSRMRSTISRRGPEKVRLLEILERPVRAHHAPRRPGAEAGAPPRDRSCRPGARSSGDRSGRVRIAPVAREVVADRPQRRPDHLLVAGGAGEPAVGGGDPRRAPAGRCTACRATARSGSSILRRPTARESAAGTARSSRARTGSGGPRSSRRARSGGGGAPRSISSGPPAALRELHAERLELVSVPARSDAEHEAPARQVPERLDLASQRDRMVVGQDQEPGREPDPRGDAGGVGQAEQRRHPHGPVEAGRLQEVLGDPKRVEPEVVGPCARTLFTRAAWSNAEVPPRERRKIDAGSRLAAGLPS